MIDADTGNIHLPNGYVITPELTLDEFRRSWFGREAGINRPPSTPKHCWFFEDAGSIGPYPVSVQLSFQEQALTSVCLTCDTLMTADTDGEYDMAWIKRKGIHDALLTTDLGESEIFTKTSRDEPGLDRAPNYLLPWGKAVSEFDDGGGDAYILVEYTSNKAL